MPGQLGDSQIASVASSGQPLLWQQHKLFFAAPNEKRREPEKKGKRNKVTGQTEHMPTTMKCLRFGTFLDWYGTQTGLSKSML